jgi:monovalent cation:H+ antiporter, CPA1 family
MLETSLQKIAIEENLEQFLLVLLVALRVAILPQILSWFRRIPYRTHLRSCERFNRY